MVGDGRAVASLPQKGLVTNIGNNGLGRFGMKPQTTTVFECVGRSVRNNVLYDWGGNQE